MGYPEIAYLENFKSDDGIGLCITQKQLVEILGEPHETQKHGENKILIYKADDMKKYEFLRLHNMPEYKGLYLFYKNELVWFLTGFPNP